MENFKVQDTRRRSGWFWLDNEIFDMELDPYSFMVYAYLVRIADRASEVASISLRKMEKALCISRKKLIKALRELEEKGMVIKKQRKGEKGNYYSNIYILTSKEDWHYPKGGPSRSTGVVSTGNHGGVSWKPGVVSVGNHGGLQEKPPPSFEEAKNLENQREEIDTKRPIKNNKNQKNINNQKSSPPYIERSDGGGDENESFLNEKIPRKGNRASKKSNSSNGSKRDKGISNLKKSSAGGRSELENPEEVLKRLKEKWGKLLEGQSFKRLTTEQVIFFLENSALSPEETLAIVKKDDENPKIENPVGTLYKSLPMKDEKYRWLLKYEGANKEEAKGWREKFRKKLQMLEAMGVKIKKVRDPKTEEEAEEILQNIRKKLYKKVLSKLSDEEIKEIEKQIGVPKEDPMYEEMRMAFILGKKGFSEHMFSLYVF